MRTVTMRTATTKTVPRRIATAMMVVVLGLATAACSDDANDLPAGDTVETTVAPESSGTGSSGSIDPAPDSGQPGDTTVDTGTPGGDPGTGGGGSATSTAASVSP